ncbi:helix-turn-helix domain-containing protein [Paenibacillus residui]|uniref:Helix-turn-helix domain-containing protein n=1 Tax=Paenibacillus residui TaxID=629724 RepID=A0ABW3DJC5_9BACL
MKMEITTERLELIRYDEEFVNTPHTHEGWYQITVPIRGTCVLTQYNQTYRLQPGASLLQRPMDEHHFHIGAKDGVIIIKIREDLLASRCDGKITEISPEQQFDPGEVADRFRSWTTALCMVDGRNPAATEAEVLHYLWRTFKANSPSPAGASPRRSADPHLAGVFEYIQEHYTNPIAIDTLASIALQSRFHFIRTFKQSAGITPYQYILQLRVEEAKKRLRQTSATVTHISASLGFSCTSQFYRAFFKSVGLTPEQYRRFNRDE